MTPNRRIRAGVVTLLAAALALPLVTLPAEATQAMTGGATAPEAYSFAGSLQRPADSPRKDGHVCGVTLIAPQWALTAAHCARNPSDAMTGVPRGWKVRVGSLDVRSGGVLVDVDHFYRKGRVYDGDIALLHLAESVDLPTAALADDRPVDGTQVRIVGWGVTCEDRDERCFPKQLRQADTEVQPASRCSDSAIEPTRELCIGAADGSIAATNMDSGGPALRRDGDGWTVVGTVTGSNGPGEPVIYQDVAHYRPWIDGIVDGTAVPADDRVPDMSGAIELDTGCSASLVRTSASRGDDPALMLTNGHCLEDRPKPGQVVTDRPAAGSVDVLDAAGYPVATAERRRLVYATMTGTDIALVRLDRTYDSLEESGAKVFTLSEHRAERGDRVSILNGGGVPVLPTCTIGATVSELREGGYTMRDAYRYVDGCDVGHGSSGSPLLAADGQTVLAVHSSGNDDGKRCVEDNPCEVDADGKVTVHKGASYAERTDRIAACVTPGSRVDLEARGCELASPSGPWTAVSVAGLFTVSSAVMLGGVLVMVALVMVLVLVRTRRKTRA